MSQPSNQPTTIRWEQDDTGVVTLVLDDPGQPVNTANAAFRASLDGFEKRPDAAPRDSAPVLDESLFRRVLVEPFRLGGSAGWVERAWDADADRSVESAWVTGPADAVLLVDLPRLCEQEFDSVRILLSNLHDLALQACNSTLD